MTAGVLACAVIGFAPRPASAQAVIDSVVGDHHKLPVTAVGACRARKSNRRTHDSGRADSSAPAAGDGNEFILVNATIGLRSMQVAPASEAEVNNCAASPDNGQAIELTGHAERDLGPMVGHASCSTACSSTRSNDPEPSATSGEFTPRPTGGGIDLTGAELALREINVDAFALAPIAAPVREAAAIASPEPRRHPLRSLSRKRHPRSHRHRRPGARAAEDREPASDDRPDRAALAGRRPRTPPVHPRSGLAKLARIRLAPPRAGPAQPPALPQVAHLADLRPAPDFQKIAVLPD